MSNKKYYYVTHQGEKTIHNSVFEGTFSGVIESLTRRNQIIIFCMEITEQDYNEIKGGNDD